MRHGFLQVPERHGRLESVHKIWNPNTKKSVLILRIIYTRPKNREIVRYQANEEELRREIL